MAYQTQVVIFNAPPGSGKDDVCKHLESLDFEVFAHKEFKTKLIEITRTIYSISHAQWDLIYTRENKDTPMEVFDGLSARQALIKVSETVIKPNYGKDYFGKAAAVNLIEERVNVFSDGGFIEEIAPLSQKVGKENLHIVRIHRPGYTFESFGDSRKYITTEQAMDVAHSIHDVHNDGTLKEFFETVYDIIEEYVL